MVSSGLGWNCNSLGTVKCNLLRMFHAHVSPVLPCFSMTESFKAVFPNNLVVPALVGLASTVTA